MTEPPTRPTFRVRRYHASPSMGDPTHIAWDVLSTDRPDVDESPRRVEEGLPRHDAILLSEELNWRWWAFVDQQIGRPW